MKKITLTAVLFALCFATGFTCSKNAPQQAAQPVETTPANTATTMTTTQETMTAPPTTEGAAATTTSTTTTTTAPVAVPAQPTTPEAHK